MVPFIKNVRTKGRLAQKQGGYVDLVLEIRPKCGQGGRGSKMSKILWTFFMDGPYQGPSETVKNSHFGQNAKITPSAADFIAEHPCGGHFQWKCLTLMIFRIFCGTFSRHFLLARNSPS